MRELSTQHIDRVTTTRHRFSFEPLTRHSTARNGFTPFMSITYLSRVIIVLRLPVLWTAAKATLFTKSEYTNELPDDPIQAS